MSSQRTTFQITQSWKRRLASYAKKIYEKRLEKLNQSTDTAPEVAPSIEHYEGPQKGRLGIEDEEYQGEGDSDAKNYDSDADFRCRTRSKKPRVKTFKVAQDSAVQTPRTRQLLDIINSRDVSQIRLLRGVGVKKAEAIVEALCVGDDDAYLESLGQLGRLKGVGAKTVDNMRMGFAVSA